MKSISQVLIVADDLTGACDAAAQFVGRALAGPVIAYSTETRDQPEIEIIRRIESLARAADEANIIFKKIDSTLRGNIQAEIEVATKVFNCTTAIVTPAFPDMGRIVKNGHLLIHGVINKPAGANVLDAETNEDLDQIVTTGLTNPSRILWAGSAGLAAALARHLYGALEPLAAPSINGPIAFCIGSDHPATLAQQIELSRRHPEARLLPIRRAQTTAEEIRNTLTGAAALFITGGDTASTVLEAVGAQNIAVRGEVVTGVPWGMLSGGIFDGCPVVTKSGGFGSPDTLLKVAAFFTQTVQGEPITPSRFVGQTIAFCRVSTSAAGFFNTKERPCPPNFQP